ncbi:hypothetical protein Ddc_17704 [Ditylenchus destructor]|nr:hypothetical protein Ddc_17704 [Ditylenchus destructor]
MDLSTMKGEESQDNVQCNKFPAQQILEPNSEKFPWINWLNNFGSPEADGRQRPFDRLSDEPGQVGPNNQFLSCGREVRDRPFIALCPRTFPYNSSEWTEGPIRGGAADTETREKYREVHATNGEQRLSSAGEWTLRRRRALVLIRTGKK